MQVGATNLHKSAGQGQVDVFKALLNGGADKEAKDKVWGPSHSDVEFPESSQQLGRGGLLPFLVVMRAPHACHIYA